VQAAGLYGQLQEAQVVNPADGRKGGALEGLLDREATGRIPNTLLFVILPQLGDFDTFEYAEQLAAVEPELAEAGVALRVVAIGDVGASRRFCSVTGLSPEKLRVDPAASLHRALGLHAGPGWSLPAALGARRAAAEAWLNYMAMCAGISAPGTLAEIARGYLGDRAAPERLAADATVVAGPVEVQGTRRWKIGPLGAELWWARDEGYQRPVELATVRLRAMAEALGNWNEYVTDESHLAMRGATFLLKKAPDSGEDAWEAVYEWRSPGVLTYSETMPRPLSFLEPYIGELALNPLRLGDRSAAGARSPTRST